MWWSSYTTGLDLTVDQIQDVLSQRVEGGANLPQLGREGRHIDTGQSVNERGESVIELQAARARYGKLAERQCRWTGSLYWIGGKSKEDVEVVERLVYC